MRLALHTSGPARQDSSPPGYPASIPLITQEKKNLQNPDYILKLDKIFFLQLLDSII